MIKLYSTQDSSVIDHDLILDKASVLKKIETDDVEQTDHIKAHLHERILRSKKADNFTSLDRIRIVVDGLIGEISESELCKREGISTKVYQNWKKSFLDSFRESSEIDLLQKAVSTKNKKQILNEVGLSAYHFFSKYIDITNPHNLVVPKGKILSGYSDFSKIENVVLLNKVNNFRQINKQFEEVNSKLQNGGIVLGRFETFAARSDKRAVNKIPVLSSIVKGFDFVFHRIFPKLPYLKKFYFFTTKGKNRLLSKAEVLGRLVSCGFDILGCEEIGGLTYYAAEKTKLPDFNMNPSYGPLFKMNRVGKNGKIIGVYKFRTMHPYSEYLQDYVLKLNGYAASGKPADDFRLVPWGKFLRRYWLDELPQLINVLKGELKIVGVRPVSQRYFQDIPEDIRALRLSQKPGCIPPYVALDRAGAVNSVIQAEKEYLETKIKNPYFTDTKFFFKAIYNIVFKSKRSA